MSENGDALKPEVKTLDLYCFKEGMISYVDSEKAQVLAATVLRFEPHVITQVFPEKKRVQVAIGQKSTKKVRKPVAGIMAQAGLAREPKLLKELTLSEGEPQVGARVTLASLAVGDKVDVVGRSKGRGFAGVMKRWDSAGGPDAHGSKFHRRPGAVGMRTWPGRVLPGRVFPGHYGNETVRVRNLEVLKVDLENQYIVVKGAVPGARNTPIRIIKKV